MLIWPPQLLWPSQILKSFLLDKELIPRPFSMNHLKLAQLEGITGSTFGQYLSFCKILVCCSPPVNSPCTIYWESPCPSALSSVNKSCHDDADADGESKDYDLLVSDLSAVFSTTGGHVIPKFSAAVFLDAEFTVEDGLT